MELIIENEIKVTSLQIAEWSGRSHKNVIRSIRTMFKNVGLIDEPSTYEDNTGRKLPMYVLGKWETLLITSKFDDRLRWEILQKIKILEESSKIDLPPELGKTIDEILPLSSYGDLNKDGIPKTKVIRSYLKVDMKDENAKKMHRILELRKLRNGLIREEIEDEIALLKNEMGL